MERLPCASNGAYGSEAEEADIVCCVDAQQGRACSATQGTARLGNFGTSGCFCASPPGCAAAPHTDHAQPPLFLKRSVGLMENQAAAAPSKEAQETEKQQRKSKEHKERKEKSKRKDKKSRDKKEKKESSRKPKSDRAQRAQSFAVPVESALPLVRALERFFYSSSLRVMRSSSTSSPGSILR